MNTNKLPVGWAKAKLGDTFKTTSGGTPSRKNPNYYYGDIPWAKSGELTYNTIYDTEEKITADALRGSSAKIFPKGTLLIALYGATIGKLAILGIEAATNQAICGIFENKHYNTKLLFWYLFFKRQDLIQEGIGGAQPNISQTILKSIEVPLLPLPEQHRIVTKIEELFSSLDDGVASLKKAQEQLKIYRQAVLKWAFEGKLLSTKVAENLTSKWKRLKLKDITLEKDGLRRGPFGSAIKKSFFVPKGYKVYEQGNAINDDPYRGKYYVDDKKYNELINFKVLPGDLIVSCSGTLGRISEIPKDSEPGIINQALLRIRLRNVLIINKYFILYFRSELFQRKIFQQSQGTAMPNLVAIKEFKEIELIVPPLHIQHQIIQEIENRFEICSSVDECIQIAFKQLSGLRQSILKHAFEGKLVPQDPDDEPAEVLLKRITNT